MKISRPKQKLLLASGDEYEDVWGELEKEGRYVLASIPFFAYNISLGDLVETSLNKQDTIVIERVVKKSGHRTIRVLMEESTDFDSETTKTVFKDFEAMGCGIEGFEPVLLAVDIPENVEIETVINYCEEMRFEWEYGDPQIEKDNF